jgi:hypothetical protein
VILDHAKRGDGKLEGPSVSLVQTLLRYENKSRCTIK